MNDEKVTQLPFNIFLIGFMGVGKSTVASCLHRHYDMPLVEMDETLAEREGMSIPEIFATKGEPYFRQLETDFLREMQASTNVIVSCGGGVAMRQENVEIMRKSGKIVLLSAAPESILKRVKNDENRPLLKGRKTVEGISELMDSRRPYYEAAADLVVRTDTQSLKAICQEILEKLRTE